MRGLFLAIDLLVLVWAMPGRAQAPSPCDRLAGEEQKRCLQLQEERSREQERLGREEAAPPRKCDALFGPEKELCLRRGGTVRAGSGPSRTDGGSAAPGAR